MGAKVIGHKELIYKLKQLSFEAPVATGFGMYEGMQNIMVAAKAAAPKDTHAMAKSGYVAPPEVRSGAEVLVDSGFGGLSENYVIRVHQTHATRSHFFTNAIDAGRNMLVATIQKHVDRYLKTGKTTPVAKIVPAHPREDVP